MKIFVYTAPLIYLIEDHPQFAYRIQSYLIDCLLNHHELVTSVVSIGEFGVKPERDGRIDLIKKLADFLEKTEFTIQNIDSSHASLFSKLRANNSFLKPLDALQVSVAYQYGCEVFLTNDKQLKKLRGIKVKLVGVLP
ncbi:MAG: type II toxin-antitoxin system VapC family toxin [Saprospiraceae bacterium]|nr:type II toxin-antitoxin system VapC family toxin [Lewinella sp.]